MVDSAKSAASRLRQYFITVRASTRIGGAAVLKELGDLASACVIGTTPAQDAVAFVLSELFQMHAEDRNERIVTGSDNYLLMASGDETLMHAVKFVEEGGSPDSACCIVAALARLTPDRLYGRWPPAQAK